MLIPYMTFRFLLALGQGSAKHMQLSNFWLKNNL